MHADNGIVAEPDPRIVNITARLVSRDAYWNFNTVQQVQLEYVE